MSIVAREIVLVAGASIVALGLMAFGIVSVAQSQSTICGPADQVRADLAKTYGEQPFGVGITARGTILEILRTPDGATWTMLETRPTGVSCILSAGQSWVPETPPAAPLGDPS